jgi:hypothetical protein
MTHPHPTKPHPKYLLKIALRCVGVVVAIGAGLLCFSLGQAVLGEGQHPLKPDIDTQFSMGYTDEAFAQLQVGMDSTQVLQLLGMPLSVQHWENCEQEWAFSQDGKAWPADFAWMNRAVVLDSTGKVRLIINGMSYD